MLLNPDIYGGNEIFYADIFADMLPYLIKKEDFISAQAVKDSLGTNKEKLHFV